MRGTGTSPEQPAQTGIEPAALNSQKSYYDDRFASGYMDGFEYDIFERCRAYTVKEILKTIDPPRTVLDYGCGQGRYLAELHRMFPEARLFGCDISDVGLKLARDNHPYASFMAMEDETVDCGEQSFDLVISIEVLEHVGVVERAVQEIVRVLAPGGLALTTTPCANKYSLEWFLNWMSGGLQPSHDGYGRFASDEPGHLRRLTSTSLDRLFQMSGADPLATYFRAHLFTTLIERRILKRHLSKSMRTRIALCDWHFFKRLPNGATMLALYRKRS